MKKQTLFLLPLTALIVAPLYAQHHGKQTSFGVDYTTEMQTNFNSDKYNWANLLFMSGELPTEKISNRWRNGSFIMEAIAIYKPNDPIAEDMLTFSNIEDDNRWFNLSALGYTHQWEKFSLYGGLRHLGHDYFTTPYTSLFTSSSPGILPTLSINYPLSSYPLSGLGLHFEYKPTEQWLFKTSLYNGVIHDPKDEEKHKYDFSKPFIFNPGRDGIFSISELSYSQSNFGSGVYSLGAAAQTKGDGHKSTSSLWGAVEQAVFDNDEKEIGFILHGGLGPKDSECRHYYAVGGYFAGLLTKQKQDKLGIYLNTADFSDFKERTMEITWQFQITDAIAIQPAFHHIRTGDQTTNVGLFRVLLSIR